VFDLDGTLIDTADEFVAVVGQLRQEHALPPMDPTVIRKAVSGGSGALVTLALDRHPHHNDYETLRDTFLDYYSNILGRVARPYPGLRELVRHLGSRGVPWGVATNKFRRFAEPLMNAMDFDPVCGCLVTPCDVAEAKPHPESILLSCTRLDARPENTVYIGDHKRDIDAGRAAGCYTIAATYGYIADDDDPDTWRADATANSSEELATMITRMLP